MAIAAVVCVLGGAVVGAMTGHGALVVDAAAGAAMGASLLLGATIHLVVRLADGRGVAAARPESEPDSVERQVWREAGSRTCADAIGILVLVALLCLWTPSQSLARWLPMLGLLVVVVDLAVRARMSWRARVPRDAQ